MIRARLPVASLIAALVLVGSACEGVGGDASPCGSQADARELTGRFVYNTPSGDLWVMDPDGSDCRQ